MQVLANEAETKSALAASNYIKRNVHIFFEKITHHTEQHTISKAKKSFMYKYLPCRANFPNVK